MSGKIRIKGWNVEILNASFNKKKKNGELLLMIKNAISPFIKDTELIENKIILVVE